MIIVVFIDGLRQSEATGMASTTMSIRPALPEDAAAVSELLGELGYQVSVEDAARRLRQLSSTGSDPVYLAVEGTTALGLIALHWAPMLHLEKPAARITALVVSGNARRRGIGARLIEHAVPAARQAGCGALELTTAAHRGDAHAFYHAAGFAQTSLRFHRSLAGP